MQRLELLHHPVPVAWLLYNNGHIADKQLKIPFHVYLRFFLRP